MSVAGPDRPPEYPGLITRAVAFVVDAVIINLVAIVVEGAVAIAVSVFHLPKEIKQLLLILGGVAYVLWTIAYFVVFWSTTGQTPGSRMMQIRVVHEGGRGVGPRRGVVRVLRMVLAALPLFAGYALIVFDSRRRGLQDRLARTVVVEAPELSIAARRREVRRDAYGTDQRAVRSERQARGDY